MKINCFILDDEPLAIKVLERYINDLPQLYLKGSHTNPMEALNIIQTQNIDLLFLDINMPRISGISFYKTLAKAPKVIFTTAYPEFAVEGFELEALDYLVKPFSFERFLKAVNKFKSNFHTNQKPVHLIIKADRKLFQLNQEEILFLQAFGDYVKIFTHSKSYLPKETLQKVEERLDSTNFLRIHRSYIVSLNAISFIEGNQVNINGKMLPIAQKYKEQLLTKFKR